MNPLQGHATTSARMLNIIALAQREGCTFVGCPVQTLRVDLEFLAGLTLWAGGERCLFVLSHGEQRLYRVPVATLVSADLPTDVVQALATADPCKEAVLALSVFHAGPSGKAHYAEFLRLSGEALETTLLAIVDWP